MLPPGFHVYAAGMENITLAADAGDFFLLLNAGTPFLVLEARVWQEGTTTLTMENIQLRRGAGGAGGTGVTEYEYRTAGPAPTVTGTSLPTTDVTPDWEYGMGWNLLSNDAHWLPIPALWVPCATTVDFAIGRRGTTAHTGVGCSVVWAEFIGS